MFTRVWTMLGKEFLQVLRDPRMRIVIFVIPCLQTLLIGYAVTIDVKHVPTALFDLDETPETRELGARFWQSGYFDLVREVGTYDEARRLIDRGAVSLVLHFRHGFADDLRAGRTAAVQMILDGTDSNTASIVMGYTSKIISGYSRQQLVARMERLRGAVPLPGQILLKSRAWFNENLESRNYYVPGVVAIVVTLVTLLLTSMAVVREKEIGTMEQIMVTPITAWEFILGKTLPFAIIGYIDVLLVAGVGVYWFNVPIQGSVGLLLFATGLYLLTTLSVGLLISTVSQTQQQAMMGSFFFFFPVMLLSGFVFPVENMPVIVQWMTWLNPLRFYLVILRGIFLKGIGLDTLWPPMAVLATMGGVTLTMAVQRFHKTL